MVGQVRERRLSVGEMQVGGCGEEIVIGLLEEEGFPHGVKVLLVEEAADAGCSKVSREVVVTGFSGCESLVGEKVRNGVKDGRKCVSRVGVHGPNIDSLRHIGTLHAVGREAVFSVLSSDGQSGGRSIHLSKERQRQRSEQEI